MTVKVQPEFSRIIERCPFLREKKGARLKSKEIPVAYSIFRQCDPVGAVRSFAEIFGNSPEEIERAEKTFNKMLSTPATCDTVKTVYNACRGCKWNDCGVGSPIDLGYHEPPPPKEEPKLTDWNAVSASRFLVQPPKREYVFNDLMQRGIVGAIFAAGGTGKSFLMLQLALSLATGKPFSVFRPARKARTLYLGAEDSENELHRRVFAIARESGVLSGSYDLTNNFGALSICGQRGPLIAFDANGNAAVTDTYHWLDESLENLKPEILILDPMSRLFGLSENDNADATAFIACLERLARRHNLTALFCHHESKAAARNGNIQENSGRGASAFIDGCRWALVMRNMSADDGKLYNVNPREYIELDIRKSNYAAKLPSSVFMKRGPDGVLQATNLDEDLRMEMIHELVRLIAEAPEQLSVSQLERQSGAGAEIAKSMKDRFKTFTRVRDIPRLICRACDEGLIKEVEVNAGTKTRTVLQVVRQKDDMPETSTKRTCEDLRNQKTQVQNSLQELI